MLSLVWSNFRHPDGRRLLHLWALAQRFQSMKVVGRHRLTGSNMTAHISDLLEIRGLVHGAPMVFARDLAA